MASKFQNRLVGTVILVTLGVIWLPGLLDGQKKQYEERFAAIPLVPKPGDPQENEMLPALNQALPLLPPEGAAGAQTEQNRISPLPGEGEPEAVPQRSSSPLVVETPEDRPAEAKTEQKPQQEAKPKPESRPEPKPEPKPPVGQSYVVQLGALNNADKVNEIVAQLRLSGYQVFTEPAKPVKGQLTRIFVGPDASRQKLEASLPELKSLSSLQGQIRTYSGR